MVSTRGGRTAELGGFCWDYGRISVALVTSELLNLEARWDPFYFIVEYVVLHWHNEMRRQVG